MSALPAKIPATIITGFLGAGKTTLVRHLLSQAKGRRLAVIVNEFGSLGIDGEILKNCGIEGCREDDIVELANGCLCCTVADDFVPTMVRLIERSEPPDHIIIETSGLALPKPLLKAFHWPSVRSRLTVDGVVAVVDSPAVLAGRFADDPAAVAVQRADDPSLDHDNPLAEVYEDQLNAADLVILNKTDLLSREDVEALAKAIAPKLPRAVKIVRAREGQVDAQILLGLDAAAENDLASRPSHHDGEDGAHEHDDFDSFVVAMDDIRDIDALIARLQAVTAAHDILRMKGFFAVAGKPMRLAVQGVGPRFRSQFDRAWMTGEARQSHLVVIGRSNMARDAILAALTAA